MTYNICNAKGLDGIIDYQRIADVILKESPDYVSIQEIDSVTRRSYGVDVLKEIAKRTGMFYVFGASISFDGGKYGLGVLSKEKNVNARSVTLPGREEQRQLFIVEFNRFILASTHFSLNDEDRLASVAIVRKEAEYANKPFFIAGDLNSTPLSDVIDAFAVDFDFLNNLQEPTFPADNPDVCIDYIAIYKSFNVKVLDAYVVDEPVASDHRPVSVKVVLP